MTFQPTRPASYTGVRAPTPINLWTRSRDPNFQDLALYTIGDLWYNKVTNEFWILSDTGSFGALWEMFTFGATVTLTGDDAVPVSPVSGNIDVLGGLNAIQFTSGGPGVLNAAVQVDGVTIGINGAGQLQQIGSSSMTWNVISLPQTLAVNNGYICVGGAINVLGLPATSFLGDIIEVTLEGPGGGYLITQGAGQQIRFGNQQTTVGIGGSILAATEGDTIRMVCQVANLKWNILSSIGNLIVT